MSELFKIVKQIQDGNSKPLEIIIKKFEPKVNSLLKQTGVNNREDLRQELLLTIIIKTRKYKLDKVPNFDEFRRMIL
ncbi:helix-turn-helix domain-containing protein [Desulfitibacter alkalitolerans]|uniref:helix-turn-helix domain-containing protein n=1 Tax=Desulfitibacter alkalitolerans TaxID=264641 RepID=UPI0005577E73|nr:helix-turn-helix domain-containing protein [Desulfitibacter alkalitolerans]